MGESRIEDILEATINGKKYTEEDPSGSRIETLLIELNELIIEGGGGGSSTAYATALSLTINSSTYVMTAQLLNKDGDPLGTAQTVDLPLESVVVGATYDNTTKSIILTLQSGSTTSVPVGDLVSGLVSTSDLEAALATKQDTISDLSTIRSNATAGAGAAEVVTGIDSTANNYIELKSGKREYLSTTVPTGNIPTGSVGMGFDKGIWTYKSGTKVSEGEPTANLFDITTITPNKYINTQSGQLVDTVNTDTSDYISVQAGSVYTLSMTLDGTLHSGSRREIVFYDSNNTQVSPTGYDSTSTVAVEFTIPATAVKMRFDYDKSYTSIMLNVGSTPLPYEPFGKKFPFYANGQNLTDYTIYGATGGVGDEVTDSESAHYGEYDIPVICGNATTHIYLVSPLGANDSIDYATAQVAIPTIDGANSLICDTSIQPSKVSLTFTGWHSDLYDINSRLAAIEQAIANV